MAGQTPETKRRGSGRRASDPSPGSIECRVLQKNFKAMYKTVVGGEVPEGLLSRGIINLTTLEITTKAGLTEREKGHKVMQELMKAVEVKPKLFEEICTVLEQESSEPARELAKSLRSKWLATVTVL